MIVFANVQHDNIPREVKEANSVFTNQRVGLPHKTLGHSTLHRRQPKLCVHYRAKSSYPMFNCCQASTGQSRQGIPESIEANESEQQNTEALFVALPTSTISP